MSDTPTNRGNDRNDNVETLATVSLDLVKTASVSSVLSTLNETPTPSEVPDESPMSQTGTSGRSESSEQSGADRGNTPEPQALEAQDTKKHPKLRSMLDNILQIRNDPYKKLNRNIQRLSFAFPNIPQTKLLQVFLACKQKLSLSIDILLLYSASQQVSDEAHQFQEPNAHHYIVGRGEVNASQVTLQQNTVAPDQSLVATNASLLNQGGITHRGLPQVQPNYRSDRNTSRMSSHRNMYTPNPHFIQSDSIQFVQDESEATHPPIPPHEIMYAEARRLTNVQTDARPMSVEPSPADFVKFVETITRAGAEQSNQGDIQIFRPANTRIQARPTLGPRSETHRRIQRNRNAPIQRNAGGVAGGVAEIIPQPMSSLGSIRSRRLSNGHMQAPVTHDEGNNARVVYSNMFAPTLHYRASNPYQFNQGGAVRIESARPASTQTQAQGRSTPAPNFEGPRPRNIHTHAPRMPISVTNSNQFVQAGQVYRGQMPTSMLAAWQMASEPQNRSQIVRAPLDFAMISPPMYVEASTGPRNQNDSLHASSTPVITSPYLFPARAAVTETVQPEEPPRTQRSSLTQTFEVVRHHLERALHGLNELEQASQQEQQQPQEQQYQHYQQ